MTSHSQTVRLCRRAIQATHAARIPDSPDSRHRAWRELSLRAHLLSCCALALNDADMLSGWNCMNDRRAHAARIPWGSGVLSPPQPPHEYQLRGAAAIKALRTCGFRVVFHAAGWAFESWSERWGHSITLFQDPPIHHTA